PNITFAHLFVQQTFGLGGETETLPDGPLQLPRKVDISRITLMAGKLSAKDYFDVSSYANDARTQFLNWSLMANGAWDYPADSLGYTPGVVADWHEHYWSFRYGAFQVPRAANSAASDPHFLEAWSMAAEVEHRHQWHAHPGAVQLLAYLNRAHMGSYDATLADPSLGADISLTREYRYKHGFGLNAEQELTRDLGVFLRLGWSDGKSESWAFTDVDRTASLGLSLKGTTWHRPEDTLGIAGVINAISGHHAAFLAAGGTGILAGDGALSYATERILEVYYDFHVWKTAHLAVDFQYLENPAYNRDRGPVPVFGARLHWEL
ncbi:MAG TPA: carbohydrate porin, partial [Verrucomicrobiae bacterium]